MLKIGFIVDTCSFNYKPFRNQPLVHIYLLTILEEKFANKVDLSLIDLRGISKENLLFHIPECDVYLMSVVTPAFSDIVYLTKGIRTHYPKAKLITGGPHINIYSKESSQLFDSIILGEGEESLIKAISDVMESGLKPIYNQEKMNIDINAYPYGLRKYLPKTAVVDTGILGGKFQDLKGSTAIFSRGCPFRCSYCAGPHLLHGSVRFRSSELITAEIEYLKHEYQIEALALKDDNGIPTNYSIAKQFLEAIGKAGIKWRGQSRANGVHPDSVKLAKESGCVDIGIGIESVSEMALKLMRKNIDLYKAKEYIRLLNENDIGARLNFILGLPGEPEDIAEKTLSFINETKPSSVLLSIFTPFPGTEVYNFPDRFGMKYVKDDWDNLISGVGRFDENETPKLLFEYKKKTPWGEGLSNEKILKDYTMLQSILRERGLNF